MTVRNSIINSDGTVNWQEFERIINENPGRDFSDIFVPAELRAIYAKENTHEYYVHLGNIFNRKGSQKVSRSSIN